MTHIKLVEISLYGGVASIRTRRERQMMLSKWWRTASARKAFRREEQKKRDRIRKLKERLKKTKRFVDST